MKNHAIAGIDPGNSGAIAFLVPEGARLYVVDMPVFEYYTTKNKVKVDPAGVANTLGFTSVANVYIEDVYSSPQMGVVSAFNFGEGKGILLGSLAAHGIPCTPVKPAAWKKAMRCPADKKATVMRASQLFPAVAPLFKGPRGGVFDGRAEAAVLALYGALDLGRSPTKAVEIWKTTNEKLVE